MINKDLNLSLDHSFLKPKPALKRSPGNTTVTPLTTAPASTPNHSTQKPGGNVSFHQPTIIGVVMLNAVFLLIAGVWLAEQFNNNSNAEIMYTKIDSNRGVAVAELSNQLDKLQTQLTQLTQQSDALQQQFEALQLVFRAEQQQIVSDYLDMNNQLLGAISQVQNTSRTTPLTDIKTAMKNWYVNIGTFVNEEAALGLQEQIIDLGYPATIHSLELDSKVVQRVQIPGFADRASAEAAAQKIMETTKLNGLWAWKGR